MSLTNKQKLFNACHNYEFAYVKFCARQKRYNDKIEELNSSKEEFMRAEKELMAASLALKEINELEGEQ